MRRLLLIALGVAACQTSLKTSETDQDLTTISTTLLDFGSPQVGTSTAYQSGYIRESTHSGDTVETITGILYNGSSSPAGCPDFTLSASVPGYAELDCSTACPVTGIVTQCPIIGCTAYDYDFSANFHPSLAANESCAITFQIASGAKSVTLHGIGAPPPIHVGASPGSVAFGGVRITTDSTGVGISVSNSGGATATINSVTASAGFTITAGTTGAHALGAGTGEGFTVVCHPNAVGAMSGSFNVSSNDPSTPNIAIPLSCSGIDSSLAIAPSPAVLATLRVGETEQKTITITNMGAAATSIQAVTVTGMTMVSAPPPGTPLGAGAGTSATVQFDATAKGDVSGTLHVDYDNGKSIETQITAKAVNTSLSLTPDGDIDFANVCVGQSKNQMFNLIANDEGSFKLTAASAPEDPSFTLTPPTLPAVVQGSAANMVQFMISASPTAPGDVTSTISLDTDIPSATAHVLNLHALGLAAGVNGPPQVDLGGNPINQTSVGQHVEISNCTDTPVTISAVVLSGVDAGEFAIVDQPDSPTIDPFGSVRWLVVLQAHTEGDKTASFDATTDTGTMASVPLIGEGLGSGGSGDGPTDGTKSSYYACSTGHPSSLWPIGFALGALLIRRRRR
ncbi:MAG: choice-of-anchor D domain-containing protein [Kofleriaceae bacterium]